MTGLGLVSVLGLGPEDHAAALRDGRGGPAPITRFPTEGFKTRQGGQCDESRLAGALHDRFPGARVHDLGVDSRLLAYAAAGAIDDAKLRPSGCLPVVIGTTLEGFWQGEQWYEAFSGRSPLRARPRRLLQMTSGAQLATLAELLGIGIEPEVVSNACATGVSAIGRLFRRIRSGACDAGLAGGYDTLTRFIQLGFDSLGALTPKACAPFDRERSGFFLGDGAAVLALEELQSARRRGARIRAELVGYGESADGHHPTHPHPEGEGLVRAIRLALDSAGLGPEAVEYVNAHGTATPANDAAEAKGLVRALGEEVARRVPVSSTKALTGHTLGAAGALEQCFCVLALERGFLPVQANLREPDPACPLAFVRDPRGTPRIAMNTSLGFGGANGVLLARRWEEEP
ncbi:MAG TPA: beta-ketoacyl-[acyl-carrier-protein] synthase family protein [Planctomycetota bacterium]|nr:beta-ketoacyl-[acyl-carrier-protein] synthase family protein [Planctomycetota bacterium]